jgi:hypothetical protein
MHILLTTTYHYYLSTYTHVNEKIGEFNRKVRKGMRLNKHVTILKTPQDRDYFTRHGLHLNGQGKEIFYSQLATTVGEW